ncbi:MAG: TerB family tellurite resistance protein [Nannocystaceae bacterium]|nr:TerB family tellurite resistance protein [bacterium]
MASENRDDNRLFCEIVAVLLISDAQVTDSEQRFLDRLMKRFEFSSEDRQAVFNSVNIGESVEGRLRQLSPERRPELLAELEAAAIADGEIGRAEQDILDEVRGVLEREL